MDKKSIGARIRKIRNSLGHNQTEFGRLVNVSNASVSAYENGDAYPTIGALIKIAQLGNVTIEWLIMGVDATRETLKKLLSEEELQLLAAFDRADPEDRRVILRVAESIAGSKSKDDV
ncbi:MAG: helix-turn-helix transcriptional regulator [Geobacteraceae bacterium]|nr:helix-turn-helix transcriptional regulator [Geobacteraceae bacterium]